MPPGFPARCAPDRARVQARLSKIRSEVRRCCLLSRSSSPETERQSKSPHEPCWAPHFATIHRPATVRGARTHPSFSLSPRFARVRSLRASQWYCDQRPSGATRVQRSSLSHSHQPRIHSQSQQSHMAPASTSHYEHNTRPHRPTPYGPARQCNTSPKNHPASRCVL